MGHSWPVTGLIYLYVYKAQVHEIHVYFSIHLYMCIHIANNYILKSIKAFRECFRTYVLSCFRGIFIYA